MAVAADIDEAIGYTQAYVERIALDATASLRVQLELFMATFPQFSDDNVEERTVRNWKVPCHHLASRLPTAVGAQSEHMNEAAMLVYQTLCAAKYAQVDGRITTAQRDQVVADWNTAWSF